MARNKCPKCGAELETPLNTAGAAQTCPQCQTEVEPPRAGTPSVWRGILRPVLLVLGAALLLEVVCVICDPGMRETAGPRGTTTRPYHKYADPNGRFEIELPADVDMQLKRLGDLRPDHRGILKRELHVASLEPTVLLGVIVWPRSLFGDQSHDDLADAAFTRLRQGMALDRMSRYAKKRRGRTVAGWKYKGTREERPIYMTYELHVGDKCVLDAHVVSGRDVTDHPDVQRFFETVRFD
jgi:hypothetical protein